MMSPLRTPQRTPKKPPPRPSAPQLPPPKLSLHQVQPRALPFDDELIDQLLNGGIFTKRVTEICGASATGKTTFCLSVALAAQTNDSRPIYIINSEPSLIMRRLESLQPQYPQSSLDQVMALERPFTTLEAFLWILESTEFENLFRTGTAVVIIDTLPKLAVEQVIQVINRLRDLAMQYDTAIVITNGVLAVQEKQRFVDGASWSQERPYLTGTDPINGWVNEPRLGWTLTRLVDTRILLSRKNSERLMRVLYSGDGKTGMISFEVMEHGLQGVEKKVKKRIIVDELVEMSEKKKVNSSMPPPGVGPVRTPVMSSTQIPASTPTPLGRRTGG